jgi:hypothetical protein
VVKSYEPQPASEAPTDASEELSEVAEELASVAEELATVAEEAVVVEEAAVVEEEPSLERREGGRRRRRRRRSRPAFGQRSDTEPSGPAEAEPPETAAELPTEEPDAAEADSDAVERTGRPARGGRRRGRRERTGRTDDVREAIGGRDEVPPEATPDEHEEMVDEDQAEEEGEGRSDQVGFRNIPSWPDAVGMIVARNMESRAKNPGNQRSGGGPRGRGGRGNRRPSNRGGS